MRVRPTLELSFLPRPILAWFLLLAVASPAGAQPYVGASLIADAVRASGPEEQPGNGEAIGFAVRVGTPLAERWGVDLEFARSGDIEWRPDVTILATLTRTVPSLIGVLPPEISIFPTPEIAIESQLSTLTTMLWWRQELTDRFDLVYLAGAAFTRTATESRISYGQIGVPGLVGALLPARLFEQESVDYATGVIVGIDGRVEMIDHLHLVPGFRMQSVASRWIMRPSVGLQWAF